MSWNLIAYIVASLFVLFCVLPRALWLIARFVHRYTHPSAAEPVQAKHPGTKVRVPELS